MSTGLAHDIDVACHSQTVSCTKRGLELRKQFARCCGKMPRACNTKTLGTKHRQYIHNRFTA